VSPPPARSPDNGIWGFAALAPEAMPKVEVLSSENGPNLVLVDGKTVAVLCRCGQSEHKPMCDGTHRKVGFKAPKGAVTIVP
jgi:CDGSH-type Zn-finger protein